MCRKENTRCLLSGKFSARSGSAPCSGCAIQRASKLKYLQLKLEHAQLLHGLAVWV